jgi:hypothetical protein
MSSQLQRSLTNPVVQLIDGKSGLYQFLDADHPFMFDKYIWEHNDVKAIM